MLAATVSEGRLRDLVSGAPARLEVIHPSGNVDVQGMIAASRGGGVTLTFDQLDEPLSPLFGVERTAILRVWDRFGIHRAETRILAVDAQTANASMTVTPPGRFITTQSRTFFRVPATLEVALERVVVAPGAPARVERVLCHDFSAGGMSLASDMPFSINDRFLISLALPKEVAKLGAGLPKLDGRLVRVRRARGVPHPLIGVEFQNISARQRDRLVELTIGLQKLVR